MKRQLLAGIAVLGAAFVLSGARIQPRDSSSDGGTSAPAQSSGGGESGGRITPRSGGGRITGRDNTAPRPSAGDRNSSFGDPVYRNRIRPRTGGSTRPSTNGGVSGSPAGGVTTGRIRPRDPSAGGDSPARIIRDPNFVGTVERHRRAETRPGRYRWHRYNGYRYCHYYDGGFHWYGFYHGASFYWTRYHGGHWWWRDPHYGRWVYFDDGRWLWPGPDRVIYVYSDGGYYPEGRDVSPADAPAGSAEPAKPPTGGTHNSPDDKRMVQVFGDRLEAFLYDTTGASPTFMKFLGAGVERVRFSGGTGAKALRILLDFQDGTFSLLDGDGAVVEEVATAGEEAAPAPPPAATPPPVPPIPKGD